MDKDKKQQLALIILIPVFLLSLLYARMQKASKESAQEIKQEESISEDKRIDHIPLPNGPLDTEHVLLKTDPLKDLFQFYLYKVCMVTPEEKIDIPLPTLTIEGIIWNSDMPQAIIDGKVVRIGDVVKDVEIVGIEKRGIIVVYNGEKIIIER